MAGAVRTSDRTGRTCDSGRRLSGHDRGVIPIVTPEEMAAVDAAAPEPVEVLIHRAGGALARAAVELLGGTYGRRVTVSGRQGQQRQRRP